MKKFPIWLFMVLVLSFCHGSAVFAEAEQDNESELFNQQYDVVQVFNSSNGRVYVSDEDVYLMAQVVHAESRAEPYEGKVAVASVILNRVRNPKFPNTIEGVVKQKNAFSCVRNGRINVVPDEESYRAVLDALKGKDPTDRAVFFYNPRIATSSWMKNVQKQNVKSIGNHVFFIAG